MAQYITGNDGFVHLGSHGYAHFSTWAATFTRTSTLLTGFDDSVARRRLGVLDATGSAGGHLKYDTANNTPTGHFIAGTDGSPTNIMDGHNITLGAIGVTTNGDSAGNGKCGYNITAVLSSIALSSDKNGDATVSFNWEASGAIAEIWDETAP